MIGQVSGQVPNIYDNPAIHCLSKDLKIHKLWPRFYTPFSSLIHLVACSYLFSLQGKPSALKLSLRSILKSLILEIIAVILLESLVSSKRDGRHNLRQDD